jgi:YegS/Rv2252/BmrU family lipid kinase
MRKAALLYNPDSGGSRRRQRELDSAIAILRNAGVEADLIAAETRRDGGEATRRAVACGCDTIFACGGDGTIHNIAQVLANSAVALAILPMGTANALAHDLGLPRNATAAAQAALRATPRRVALGRIEYTNFQGKPSTRYFVVAAGVGVDAHLFYKLHSGAKQRMGMTAYYAKAWKLWFTYPMTRFVAEYLENGSDRPKCVEVTELLGVRIRNFGGVLQELAPGASLDRDDLSLVFCRTASRLAYLAYVTRGLLRQRRTIPGIDVTHSASVSCRYRDVSGIETQAQRKIYVEADGELLGTLPAEITIVPNALTLLAPAR